jgi:alpha-N-arabinofuranosidase
LFEGAAGALAGDRWYPVRIRCVGPRIQVWLEGQPIVDVTDKADGHSRGRVGLASVGTRTRYRQLKISGADGVMLLAGLPPVPELSSQARHWRSYGGGRSITVETDSLNGKYSQYLKANGGETGVQQGALHLQAGDPCRGSFWARGNAQGAMVVRVLDGSTALLEKTLPPPDGTWREYPLELLVSRTVANATLQIGLRGTGEVWIDQVSLMAATSASTGGFRPDLLQAVAALRPPIIRWPGGLFASEYRWQDGIGPQHKRGTYVRPLWDDQDSNNLGTDEFIALCRRVGAEPLLVVSVGPRDRVTPREAFIKDAQAWVEYCNGPADSTWGRVRAANGHPEPYGVRYWQVGNETWPMGAEVYAECVRTFSTAMREVDPRIKIIACSGLGYGTDIYETDQKLGRPWDQLLFARYSQYFDYLDIHKYTKAPAYAEDPYKMEAAFRSLADMIARSQHPGIKVFVGEWNLQSTDWRTGLYAGGFLNACERNPVVGIATPALFLRHVSANSWDNAFVNFDQSRWFPAPNYVVMKLWWDHFAPQRVVLEGPERPLNAVATLSADSRRLILKAVNPTEDPVELRLEVKPVFAVRQATVTVVAPGGLEVRNTLNEPQKVRPIPGVATCSGQLVRCTLPPLSASVLTIE